MPDVNVQNSPFVDWGLLLRLIRAEAKMAVVPTHIYYYREKSTNSIFYGSDSTRKYYGHWKIANDYCVGLKLNTRECDLLMAAKIHS